MRLNNTEINNLAVYTGVKTDALSRFIRKYKLNVSEEELCYIIQSFDSK